MSAVITKMSAPKTCNECPFCEGHICKLSRIDVIKNLKKDCSIKPLNDIKAEIEQKRAECDPNGDSSRLVRAGIDVALRVINKYM